MVFVVVCTEDRIGEIPSMACLGYGIRRGTVITQIVTHHALIHSASQLQSSAPTSSSCNALQNTNYVSSMGRAAARPSYTAIPLAAFG